jgi:hypothetical protein
MSSRNNLQNQRPGIFSPSTSIQKNGSGKTVELSSKSDLEKAGISYSNFFAYNLSGEGIKTSQQVPLDFSKFENHTFFNSAQANVNVAFNNVINNFPFDGTRKEYETYVDGLTGFERYVLDSFPTNHGLLKLSGATGAAASTDGTYIKVNDFAGSAFPDFSTDRSGDSVLNFKNKNLAIEMQIFLPPLANGNEVVLQKISGTNQGMTMFISESSSTSAAEAMFSISSGSFVVTVSGTISKNRFNHICVNYDQARKENPGKLYLYSNQVLLASSSNTQIFGEIDFNVSDLTIGSGTTHSGILRDSEDSSVYSLNLVPNRTLSGALDEVRIFHTVRSEADQRKSAKRNIYASDELKLYYKFNEPSASFGDNSIVLDSSGNSLHSTITNYSVFNRQTSSFTMPLTAEQSSLNPVLFPAFKSVQDLNIDLLSSASKYDNENPNIITRLVPSHYFDEGADYFGYSKDGDEIVSPYSGSSIPGSGELGSSQVFRALLFTWAKHFDEIKIAMDALSNVLNPSYSNTDGIPDQFLEFLSNYYGFKLPPILTDASPDQFYHGLDVQNSYTDIEDTLQKIRNDLLRRMLANVRDIVNSKGTVSSIKSALNSLGLDADILFRIKEYGGPKKFELSSNRAKRAMMSPALSFSGSVFHNNTAQTNLDSLGVYSLAPRFASSFLSSSRLEVGAPEIAGSFVNGESFPPHGISNSRNDGLLTSGSWTFEGTYKFPITGSLVILTQSMVRMHVTGVLAPSNKQGVLANLLALSGTSPAVKLFLRPNSSSLNSIAVKPPLELSLTGVNVMDGENWAISFGRTRPKDANTFTSSSYFLRAATQKNGRVDQIYFTSSFYQEEPYASVSGSTNNAFENISMHNQSGSFLVIGSQSINVVQDLFLNASGVNSQARTTEFSGDIRQVRFWSKALAVSEWKEHVRNPSSVGVENPLLNFNFEKVATGAFERLRLDVSMDQPVTKSSSSGVLTLVDFSQNNLSGALSGFENSKDLFKHEKIFFSSISPAYDENQSSVKIRPRSFLSASNVDEYDADYAPLHSIPSNQQAQDDIRLSIDFSIANALNEDIITMFSTLDEIDSAVGDPSLRFASRYPALENLRDIYFNKLTTRVNFKEFLEFFRWFDRSVGTMIDQLVSKKTNFLGVNFVIEPHSLERGKLQYQDNSTYIGEAFRSDLKGQLLLQQIEARIRRF